VFNSKSVSSHFLSCFSARRPCFLCDFVPGRLATKLPCLAPACTGRLPVLVVSARENDSDVVAVSVVLVRNVRQTSNNKHPYQNTMIHVSNHGPACPVGYIVC
jgi:hypothetical protein